MQQVIHTKVPMPHSHELDALPSAAKHILDSLRNTLDFSEYKYLARTFVDVVDPSKEVIKPTVRKGNLRYNNPKSVYNNFDFSGIGEYNPDEIPVHVYEKMGYHPQIALGTALIILPILAQNYRIESSNEKIAMFCDHALRPIYRQLVKDMLECVQYGFSAGEKIYENKDVKITKPAESDDDDTIVYNDFATVISRVKYAYPASIKIVRNKRTELIKSVTQTNNFLDSNNLKPRRPVKIEKIVWFAPDSKYGNFFGTSRYKAAYQWWYFGQILVQFMMRYLERRGAPAAVARVPFGTSTTPDGEKLDNMEYGLRCAEAVVSNSAVALPRDFDKNSGKDKWDLDYLKDDQRGDMFIDVLRYLDMMIMRAMLIPDRVATSDGGSTNASAESHVDIHLLNLEALIQMLELTLKNSVVDDLVKYNFPPSEIVPVNIKIERLNFSKKTLLKDIFLRMLMFASSNAREGVNPTWVPSIRKLAELLEIPGDEYEKIFWPTDEQNDNNVDSDKTDDADKTEKIQQRNRDALQRKDRTRRDRRSRERLEE